MKIAVTSQNFKTVTNHAGKARRFIIYNVIEGQEPEEIERLDLSKDMAMSQCHGEEEHPIDKVDVLLSASFGEGFASRMKGRGVIASLTEKQDPIEAIKDYQVSGQILPQGSCGHDHEHSHSAHKGCGCHCHD